ncbi:helix-turn-helix transcriptional regulator [Myxococcus sp. Y35]|uniref:helix-turn-helix transcriptional regulator n=1 Tax=Pseudomyxococcus flavus TaxID=3115648 RepID=UPI003CE70040
MGNCDGNDETLSPRLSVVRGGASSASTTSDECLWTLDEVCAYLKMGKTWVRTRVAAGTFPVVRLGAAVRFRPAEVREWLDGQTKGAR